MNDNEFLHLITLYLEDAIQADDLESLNRELANSPDRVRLFNDVRQLTGLIHEHGRNSESANSANLTTHNPVQDPPTDSPTLVIRTSEPRILHPTRRLVIFISAALTTAASLFVLLRWTNTQPVTTDVIPVIATLEYSSHARWKGKERAPGDLINEGELHLEVGLARLDFRNGATVTLQGPADIEIASARKAILNRGILTASVPASATGFEILTPAMDVVDLGTSFGVSVGADGETDVCVFEGEVEVSLNDGANPPQLVREGNAVRSRPKANNIHTVNYATERYEKAWPVTSGVLQATGLMKFVAPGPEFIPGKYEDSERILVFLERSQVMLESDLEIDVSESGQYLRVRRQNKQLISAGQMVRSYLLQLNPIGEFTRNEVDGARVIGQIIFDKPILGLIGGTKLLTRTDELLGHPRGNYGNTRRGIEPTRPDDHPDSGRDNVTLSEDRRTLSLDLSASSAVDQIRVIVQEQPAENLRRISSARTSQR